MLHGSANSYCHSCVPLILRISHSQTRSRSYRQCHRCIAPVHCTGAPSPNNFQGAPDRRTSNFFSYHKISHFHEFQIKILYWNKSYKYNTCRQQQIEPDRSHITIIKCFIWKIIKTNLKIAFAWSGSSKCTRAPKSLATALRRLHK